MFRLNLRFHSPAALFKEYYAWIAARRQRVCEAQSSTAQRAPISSFSMTRERRDRRLPALTGTASARP